ncbi:hypothetical protein [Labrys sp. WJW]|uniref:hypothetical protein n=1 Tax=Labrys sp. WJW TaxID=1737983 RepID=UPI0012EA96F9|nr:hypothetical protein [Labrys sp. WJW]
MLIWTLTGIKRNGVHFEQQAALLISEWKTSRRLPDAFNFARAQAPISYSRRQEVAFMTIMVDPPAWRALERKTPPGWLDPDGD